MALASLLGAAGLLAAGGCRAPTKEAADCEVYSILSARRQGVPEVAGKLHIADAERRAHAARREARTLLALKDALRLATAASREYREERDRVYLAALTVTEQRRAFETIPGASAGGDVLLDETGTSVDAGASASLSRALKGGGSIALSLATDFLRNFGTDPLRVAQSILSADLIVPLARGSGALVTLENWRQAERNAIYALRSFARFQQEFTVSIADQYFRALAAAEIWRNEEAAFESLTQLVLEQTEKARAGRIPEFQVDQARQDLLRSDDRRQRERATYELALDRLKLDLGIPVQEPLDLDPAELSALVDARAHEPVAEATRLATALARRLDLKNSRDQEVDALRKVDVARNALAGQVDLRLGADLLTPGESPTAFDRAKLTGNVGLDVDLPLERTPERNAWVAAMIAATQASRGRERVEDGIVQEVREAARRLDQATRSSTIQAEGVRLAERRVESTALFLEQGDATIRDRLDAEDARRQARNALTTARVDQFLAWLRLQSDVGTLRVDGEGAWQMPASPSAPGDTGTPPAEAKPQGDAASPPADSHADGTSAADAHADDLPPTHALPPTEE